MNSTLRNIQLNKYFLLRVQCLNNTKMIAILILNNILINGYLLFTYL